MLCNTIDFDHDPKWVRARMQYNTMQYNKIKEKTKQNNGNSTNFINTPLKRLSWCFCTNLQKKRLNNSPYSHLLSAFSNFRYLKLYFVSTESSSFNCTEIQYICVAKPSFSQWVHVRQISFWLLWFNCRNFD